MTPAAEILRLAARLACCRACALDWYRNDAIAEFGDLTAEQMVERGEGERVLAFLAAIVRGQRG